MSEILSYKDYFIERHDLRKYWSKECDEEKELDLLISVLNAIGEWMPKKPTRLGMIAPYFKCEVLLLQSKRIKKMIDQVVEYWDLERNYISVENIRDQYPTVGEFFRHVRYLLMRKRRADQLLTTSRSS